MDLDASQIAAIGSIVATIGSCFTAWLQYRLKMEGRERGGVINDINIKTDAAAEAHKTLLAATKDTKNG